MTAESSALSGAVRGPVDKVVEVLLDYDAYPQWQGIVSECEVRERDGDGRGSVIHMSVDAKVRTIQYLARYSYDLPNSLSWTQISGDLKQNCGRYSFSPRDDGGTDVTIDITFEVGFFLPRPLKKLIRDQSLKNSMRELRRRVEG